MFKELWAFTQRLLPRRDNLVHVTFIIEHPEPGDDETATSTHHLFRRGKSLPIPPIEHDQQPIIQVSPDELMEIFQKQQYTYRGPHGQKRRH